MWVEKVVDFLAWSESSSTAPTVSISLKSLNSKFQFDLETGDEYLPRGYPSVTAIELILYFFLSLFTQGRMCNQPMGLQNGRLRNHLMTASSQWDKYHAAFLVRLHRRRAGKYMGAWSARSNNRYQYLQIDFTRPSKIIKIATQGRHDADQWVTQYYITYSVNLVNFVEYKERNNRKV